MPSAIPCLENKKFFESNMGFPSRGAGGALCLDEMSSSTDDQAVVNILLDDWHLS